MLDVDEIEEQYREFVQYGDGDAMESLLGQIPHLLEEVRTLRDNRVDVEFVRHDPEYVDVEFPNEFNKAFIQTTAPRYSLRLTQKGVRYTFRAIELEGVAFHYERLEG